MVIRSNVIGRLVSRLNISRVNPPATVSRGWIFRQKMITFGPCLHGSPGAENGSTTRIRSKGQHLSRGWRAGPDPQTGRQLFRSHGKRSPLPGYLRLHAADKEVARDKLALFLLTRRPSMSYSANACLPAAAKAARPGQFGRIWTSQRRDRARGGNKMYFHLYGQIHRFSITFQLVRSRSETDWCKKQASYCASFTSLRSVFDRPAWARKPTWAKFPE